MANKTKIQFSKEFVTKIEALLKEEKKRLENELKKFNKTQDGGSGSAFPSYGDKEDENANEVADYAANLTVEESLKKTLRDVQKSSERLANGTYGTCKYCKKPIEERRLLARPTSSACVECKKTIVQEL